VAPVDDDERRGGASGRDLGGGGEVADGREETLVCAGANQGEGGIGAGGEATATGEGLAIEVEGEMGWVAGRIGDGECS
jgi:hypothetical protein